MQNASQQPIKDEDRHHPIPDVWRPILRQIVRAFAEGDYDLSRGIPSVSPPSKEAVDQIRSYIEGWDEALAELPDETWDSSVSQWMRDYWDVLVDLWTVESGRSDMVLTVQVFENGEGFRFEIDAVYVP